MAFRNKYNIKVIQQDFILKTNYNFDTLNYQLSEKRSPKRKDKRIPKMKRSIKTHNLSPQPVLANPDYEEEIEVCESDINVKFIKNFFATKNAFREDYETEQLVKYVEELENLNKELTIDLYRMKEDEIKRIAKEFLLNDYERIYRVEIHTIISTIVGESHVFNEMKKYIDEKLNYYKSLELCRNYSSFQDKYDGLYAGILQKKKP